MKIGQYKHYKGEYYSVLGVATHTETKEKYVIYFPLCKMQFYIRPLKMFIEKVEHNGRLVKRFTYIGPSSISNQLYDQMLLLKNFIYGKTL